MSKVPVWCIDEAVAAQQQLFASSSSMKPAPQASTSAPSSSATGRVSNQACMNGA
jgi:hypothetical protein